ncbi:unnamed protein product, partial [marine sediment metagenome]
MPNENEDYSLLFESTLAEVNSAILTLVYNPVVGSRECLRQWPLSDPRELDKSLRALDEYSSQLNFDAGKKQGFIDTPQADQDESMAGLWNVVYNRGAKEGDPEGIYQLLREFHPVKAGESDDIANELDSLKHLCSFDETLINALGIWPESSSTESGHRQICEWNNLSADAATATALRSTVTDDHLEAKFATANYQVIARRFGKVQDGTAKFTVAFQYNQFTKTWADKELVAQMNTNGYALQETYVVEGVSEANRTTVQGVAEGDVANRTTNSVRVTEKPNGERGVSRS